MSILPIAISVGIARRLPMSKYQLENGYPHILITGGSVPMERSDVSPPSQSQSGLKKVGKISSGLNELCGSESSSPSSSFTRDHTRQQQRQRGIIWIVTSHSGSNGSSKVYGYGSALTTPPDANNNYDDHVQMARTTASRGHAREMESESESSPATSTSTESVDESK